MNTSPVTGNQAPRYEAARETGKAAQGSSDYAEMMEQAQASRRQEGLDQVVQERAKLMMDLGETMVDVLEKFKEQQEANAEGEKLDALLGIHDKDENFWEARARREEEFQELREQEARKERILERLRSGEPVSAAELLLTL